MKRRVLIAEDDMNQRIILERSLVKYDCEVFAASDGKAALDVLLSNTDIDLVISKVMLPELNGFELRKAFQKYPAIKNIPIIFFTEKFQLQQAAQELAPYVVLTNPIKTDDLEKIVVNLLTRV